MWESIPKYAARVVLFLVLVIGTRLLDGLNAISRGFSNALKKIKEKYPDV